VPPLLPLRRYALCAPFLPSKQAAPPTTRSPCIIRASLIPGLSGFNPALIARAVLPLAQRLHAERPFDLVDAQFFYPDGPAAARIARALGLPLAIKARGADIHYWGSRPVPCQIRVAARQASTPLGIVRACRGHDCTRPALHGFTSTIPASITPAFIHVRERRHALLAERVPAFPAAVRIVACVGALIPRKGQAIAIEALRDLDQDVVLVLVGAGPDEACASWRGRQDLRAASFSQARSAMTNCRCF
jgi:glycosyltransferase involved in cell wall biosynthesis